MTNRSALEGPARYGTSSAEKRQSNHALNRLNDPLGHIRHAEIPSVVRDFAVEHGFITKHELETGDSILSRLNNQEITDEDLQDDTDNRARLAQVILLQRGFLLGRDRRFTDKLTPEDLNALDLESKGTLRGHRWHLYAVILLCSMGAALQGWDQTGSAAANLTFPWRFGLDPFLRSRFRNTDATQIHDAWVVGLVNAIPYFVSPLGCLLSDPLNNWLGRLKTIFVAATFCFGSVLGCAFANPPYWGQLVVCRSLLGIGMGLKASTVPLLASESAPARIRGSLVMSWQVNVAFGVLLGSLANLITYQLKDPWRYQFGCAFIPALPVMIVVWLVPESPTWYLRKGKVKKAYGTLLKLRSRPVIACRDLLVMYHASRIEEQLMQTSYRVEAGCRDQWHFIHSYMRRMKELLSHDRNRRALQSSLVVMIAQQLCGISVISFYCNTLYLGDSYDGPTYPYQYIDNDDKPNIDKALWVSIGFGLCGFLFSFPAVKTIDRFGRVFLLMVTFPFMALWLMGLSLSFMTEPTTPNVSKAICIFFFTIFYSPGVGPVPFTYAAEAFPATHRDVGMALSVSANLLFCGAFSVAYPPLQAGWGPAHAVGVLAGLNGISFVLTWLLVVETKQLPLEVLTERFSHSTRELVRRRLAWVFPAAFVRETQAGVEPEVTDTQIKDLS